MAERFKAPVLKTGKEQSFVGSTPTPSAKISDIGCFFDSNCESHYLGGELSAVGCQLSVFASVLPNNPADSLCAEWIFDVSTSKCA